MKREASPSVALLEGDVKGEGKAWLLLKYVSMRLRNDTQQIIRESME